ncbi:MAG: transcriptional repressor [Oscillibacter sp.]|jgi:Fur family ferric uptake transcriptional regulator|nr:transcriptional repressor [Oscillibacter sp.]
MPYTTKQRQAILTCLAQRRAELLSVSELASALRDIGSPVGLATIYRQLEKLEETGHIHKVNTEEGAFYQYCDHGESDRDCFLLKCEGCGRILHLDCSHLKPLYEHLEQEHHFVIDSRATMFSGLCDVCAAQRKEETHGSK